PKAEDLDRAHQEPLQEQHGHQIEHHAHGATDAVFGAAEATRAVVHDQLGDTRADEARHHRDEAVHLTVQAHFLDDLAPHRLERAAVVVQAHVGGPADD